MNLSKKQVQSEEAWQNQMAEKILRFVQNELYQDLRFLDVALSALVWQPAQGLRTLATDGSKLYFPAERICKIFPDNPLYLNRVYLHTVLHCLFAHLWLQQGRERPWWDAACDIEVEYVIDHLEKKSVKRALSWERQKMYQAMEERKLLSAAKIYEYLGEISIEEREKLRREFYTDNHKFWPEEEKKSPMQNQAREMWDKISRQSRMQDEKRGDEPEEGEQSLLRRLKADKSRRSYRDFLRKFAVLREEMQCDPDTFELNFYTYGLSLYGNMPLIEPVETREVMRIQEFVVVLDTSYSTDGELIKGFLRETFTLLTEKDSFSINAISAFCNAMTQCAKIRRLRIFPNWMRIWRSLPSSAAEGRISARHFPMSRGFANRENSMDCGDSFILPMERARIRQNDRNTMSHLFT